MRIFLRHLCIALLPLALGLGAGYGFAYLQAGCGGLVGPIFAAKCHGRQLQYQIKFQTAGTAAGCLFAAIIGARLEHRRLRAVQQATQTGEP